MIKYWMIHPNGYMETVSVNLKTGAVRDLSGCTFCTTYAEFEKRGFTFSPIKHEVEDDGFITVHPAISDGGPASYYDFKEGWVTWNDLADHKAKTQWKEYAFHLGNIGKAIMRWGDKEGTSTLYDTKKIIYSALRVLVMMEGKEAAAKYLEKLSDDPQFKVKE